VAIPLSHSLSYVLEHYLYLRALHKKNVIPIAIRNHLVHEDLPALLEIRDLVAELISRKEVSLNQPGKSRNHEVKREILEERHSNSMTFRLEKVSCGKNCKGCPHGPYWYGYWHEGGKTRSKYIGKNLSPQKQRME
jgi:hypothetical protein